MDKAEYPGKEGREGIKRLMARARVRCGNVKEENSYWLAEEKRKYILHNLEIGTLKQLLKDSYRLDFSLLREENTTESKVNESKVKQ